MRLRRRSLHFGRDDTGGEQFDFTVVFWRQDLRRMAFDSSQDNNGVWEQKKCKYVMTGLQDSLIQYR